LLYADDLVVIAETEDNLIKWFNEWKDFVENTGMRVSTNKTKVMTSGEWQKIKQKVVSVVEVSVIIQYSVLVVRSGYTGNIVIYMVACTM